MWILICIHLGTLSIPKIKVKTITSKDIAIYKRKHEKQGGMFPIFFSTSFVRRFLRHPVAPRGLPLAPVWPRYFFKHTNVLKSHGRQIPCTVASHCLPLPPVAPHGLPMAPQKCCQRGAAAEFAGGRPYTRLEESPGTLTTQGCLGNQVFQRCQAQMFKTHNVLQGRHTEMVTNTMCFMMPNTIAWKHKIV